MATATLPAAAPPAPPPETPLTPRKREMLERFFAWAEAEKQPATKELLLSWDREKNQRRLLNYARNIEYLREQDLLRQAQAFLTSYRSRARVDGQVISLPTFLRDRQGGYHARESMRPDDVRRILREEWMAEVREKAARITLMAADAGWNLRVSLLVNAAERAAREGHAQARAARKKKK